MQLAFYIYRKNVIGQFRPVDGVVPVGEQTVRIYGRCFAGAGSADYEAVLHLKSMFGRLFGDAVVVAVI